MSACSGPRAARPCHAREGATGDDMLELAGGLELDTDFGTFVAPNISMHPTDGIGGWSPEDFANAMLRGVSPEGRHYYPAFPYASYARMETADVADLFAFIAGAAGDRGQGSGHTTSPFPTASGAASASGRRFYLNDAPALELPGRRRRGSVGAISGRGAGPLRRVPHAARFFWAVQIWGTGWPARPPWKGPGSIPQHHAEFRGHRQLERFRDRRLSGKRVLRLSSIRRAVAWPPSYAIWRACRNKTDRRSRLISRRYPRTREELDGKVMLFHHLGRIQIR